jgi:hypothetical protein
VLASIKMNHEQEQRRKKDEVCRAIGSLLC